MSSRIPSYVSMLDTLTYVNVGVKATSYEFLGIFSKAFTKV